MTRATSVGMIEVGKSWGWTERGLTGYCWARERWSLMKAYWAVVYSKGEWYSW